MRLRTKLVGSAALIVLLAGVALIGYWLYWPHQPSASQHGLVEQQVARTTVVVDYDRPVARGREPFGDVVAWGQMWMPGGEQPALLRVTTDVQINGQPLAKGTYSIWAQPRTDAWTVIFSRNTDLKRVAYSEGQDALRLTVSPRSGPHMEALAFYFPVVDWKGTELVLHWGRVVVPLQITAP